MLITGWVIRYISRPITTCCWVSLTLTVSFHLQSRMGNLTSLIPSMGHIAGYSVPTQKLLLQKCRREVDEALRLVKLDPDLSEEATQLTYLQGGLNKAGNTNQPVMGVLWLRDRFLESCEEGNKVDYKRMDEEFSILQKVVGLPKHAPLQGAGLNAVALAPAFNGAWGGMRRWECHPCQRWTPLGLPNINPRCSGRPSSLARLVAAGALKVLVGVHAGGQAPMAPQAHYGRGGGGRGSGDKCQGQHKPLPFCGKCQARGMADTCHPHTACPFTVCFHCKQLGHSKNCLNP